ncbi:MAG: hypothetical protein M3Q39_01605 [Actinomycetota bacterium]|nr:hypothetical protein [Actinomycetota bacterium]
MATIEESTCRPKVIKASSPGPRGYPGVSAIGLLPPINFSYGDASPANIMLLLASSEIISVSLQIEQAFNGTGAALSLGTAGNPNELFSAAEVLPSMEATFEFSPRVEYPAGTLLVLTITPGAGATQGIGQLVISAVPSS